mgnify:CR=1 FL=1
MPIAIKEFIADIKGSVRVALKVNYVDDRIDAVIGDEIFPFLTRNEIDAVAYPRGYPGPYDKCALVGAALLREGIIVATSTRAWPVVS